MADPSILRRVEEGAVDFRTAFQTITSTKVSSSPPPPSLSSGLSAQVRRSEAGRVVLCAVDDVTLDREASPKPDRVNLIPVDNVWLEDGLSATWPSGPVLNEAAAGERTSMGTGEESASGDVVELTYPEPGIALVTLRDETNRNMFSEGLIRGVQTVFARLGDNADVRAVVVTGYGTWFCSGGTPDTLQAIRTGGMSFLDDAFFKSLMDCPLPTIAAMQGHALGGGLTFGLYADMLVMAEHAYYAANFMDHGFTPGVGATYLFPDKFGPVLGREMLLTARRYQGRELKSRGAPMDIVPRDQVLPAALELARKLVTKPLLQLRELKAHLAHPIARELEEVFEKEQAMHDVVFAEHRGGDTQDGASDD